MAVQFESQGQLQEFLGILRKRSWQVILPAAFVIALGTALAVIVPKKYLVKTQLELRQTQDSNLIQEVRSAKMQLKAIERIRKVVEELRWPDFLALDKSYHLEYLKDIEGDVEVTTTSGGEGSAFVTIAYKNINPRRAGDFLARLRDAWIKDVIDRGRIQLMDQDEALLERRGELQSQFYQAEEELTALRQRNEVSATQPVPGSAQPSREDPFYERLQRTRNALDDARLDLKLLGVEIAKKQELLVDVPETISQQQLVAGQRHDAELVRLDGEIAAKEAERDRYRPAHSQYAKVTLEIAELNEQRRRLLGGQTEGEVLTQSVPNPDRKKLETELGELKLKRELLEQTEQELAATLARAEKDYAERQQVYTEIRVKSQRIDELRESLKQVALLLEGVRAKLGRITGPGGNPFEITEEVRTPRKPTEPNPLLIVAFALVGGFALSIATAVLGEFSRSCFRNVNDISRVLAAPVLGTVNLIVTRSDVRQRAVQRFLVGSTTLALIGGLVFITWAWAFNPDLLPGKLREVIESLRSQLV